MAIFIEVDFLIKKMMLTKVDLRKGSTGIFDKLFLIAIFVEADLLIQKMILTKLDMSKCSAGYVKNFLTKLKNFQ